MAYLYLAVTQVEPRASEVAEDIQIKPMMLMIAYFSRHSPTTTPCSIRIGKI